jgi:tRNA(adenine34) deaminase
MHSVVPSDLELMQQALLQAKRARDCGEVPVGAVILHQNKVIATGANCPIATHDPTAHAEIIALRAAGQMLGSYRLLETTLYVTLEPCVMCAAAIMHARVKRLVFGAWDTRAGGAGSVINVFTLPGVNHRVDVFGGVCDVESTELLNNFFKVRR